MTEDTELGTDDQLEHWLTDVCRELDLPIELADQQQVLLDLARDVAHHILRPAAPLTTFLVGFAAGRAAARDAPGDGPNAAIPQIAAAVAAHARRQSPASGQ